MFENTSSIRSYFTKNRRKTSRCEYPFTISYSTNNEIWSTPYIVNNAGKGGLHLTVDHLIPENSSLKTKISLPDTKKQVQFNAKVVWCNQKLNKDFDIGIKFEKMGIKESLAYFSCINNLNKYCSSTDSYAGHIETRVAQTRDELERSYKLVYQQYLKKGYTHRSKSQMRISLHNAMPKTTTFISKVQDIILATATLIPDSPMELPMEDTYRQELKELRAGGKKTCEISMFSINPIVFEKKSPLLFHKRKLFFIFPLFRLLFDYAKYFLNADYICIAIHPTQDKMYNFLPFKTFGKVKKHIHANNALSIAKYLDLSPDKEHKTITKIRGNKIFLSHSSYPYQFENKFKFIPQDLRYFFTEKTNLFKNATFNQIKYLAEQYPYYDFSLIVR